MKTSVTMRKYTVKLGLLFIVMFVNIDVRMIRRRSFSCKQKLYFRFRHNKVADFMLIKIISVVWTRK
jgi:hypothetical protein